MKKNKFRLSNEKMNEIQKQLNMEQEEKRMTTAIQIVALINIGIIFYIMWLLVK
jgi:hypothetical protein